MCVACRTIIRTGTVLWSTSAALTDPLPEQERVNARHCSGVCHGQGPLQCMKAGSCRSVQASGDSVGGGVCAPLAFGTQCCTQWHGYDPLGHPHQHLAIRTLPLRHCRCCGFGGVRALPQTSPTLSQGWTPGGPPPPGSRCSVGLGPSVLNAPVPFDRWSCMLVPHCLGLLRVCLRAYAAVPRAFCHLLLRYRGGKNLGAGKSCLDKFRSPPSYQIFPSILRILCAILSQGVP